MGDVEKSLLEKMHVDPRREAVTSRCPFCADGVLVFGYSTGSGNPCLGHTAVPDPLDPSGKTGIMGCETYRNFGPQQPKEFLRLARLAGARWSKLTE